MILGGVKMSAHSGDINALINAGLFRDDDVMVKQSIHTCMHILRITILAVLRLASLKYASEFVASLQERIHIAPIIITLMPSRIVGKC